MMHLSDPDMMNVPKHNGGESGEHLGGSPPRKTLNDQVRASAINIHLDINIRKLDFLQYLNLYFPEPRSNR